MFSPGEVIHFWSDEAGKRKYHLCISLNGHFLFLNSPKQRTYPGDYVVACSEFPFLPVTSTGDSVVCCSIVLRKSDVDLRRLRARSLGTVSVKLLQRLVEFIEHSNVLSEEEKEAVLDGLGGWI